MANKRFLICFFAVLTFSESLAAPDGGWLDNFWDNDKTSANTVSSDHDVQDFDKKLEADDLLEQDIMEELFYAYNKEVRPATKAHPVVHVLHNMVLIGVNSYRTNELIVDAWESISWVDPRLIWDPKDYEGITSISFDHNKIWKPDVFLWNGFSSESGMVRNDIKIQLESNGHVHYIPLVHHKIRCVAKSEYFTCLLTYGSWSYHGGQLIVNNTLGEVDLSGYVADSDYKVVSTEATVSSKTYPCCVETYYDLTYKITLRWKDSETFNGLSPQYGGMQQDVQSASFSAANGTVSSSSNSTIADDKSDAGAKSPVPVLDDTKGSNDTKTV